MNSAPRDRSLSRSETADAHEAINKDVANIGFVMSMAAKEAVFLSAIWNVH